MPDPLVATCSRSLCRDRRDAKLTLVPASASLALSTYCPAGTMSLPGVAGRECSQLPSNRSPSPAAFFDSPGLAVGVPGPGPRTLPPPLARRPAPCYRRPRATSRKEAGQSVDAQSGCIPTPKIKLPGPKPTNGGKPGQGQYPATGAVRGEG